MVGTVVGRETESADLSAFLDGIRAGATAALVRGEAGAGKTTLWRAAADEARARGYRVLATSPVAAETALSFAGLGDLLHEHLDDAAPRLPPPQRRALEVALLRGEASGRPPDERSLGVALLSTLRALAGANPVVVAVDDVQWLDAASTSVLRFALRRLGDETVGVLVARRVEDAAVRRDDVERSLGDERLLVIDAGPLSVGALHQIVRERLGTVLPRPLLRRIHETTGGNPFFALEVVRALGRRAEVADPREPLPVPGDLDELIRERLRGLPSETSRLLFVASALAQPTVDLLGGAREGLEPAVAAGVVDIDDGAVRFTHPLLRHAVYALASPEDRAAAHRELAEAVGDPEERARQLALGTAEPDAAVAVALERAAEAAAARGATTTAAELAERACTLTPPELEDELARRTLAAARNVFRAGDLARARTLLEALAARTSGRARATALAPLARILRWQGEQVRSLDVARAGLATDGLDDATRSDLEHHAGSTLFYLREDLDASRAHLARAVELAARSGRADLRLEALVQKVLVDAAVGAPEAAATLAAAEEVRTSGAPVITLSSTTFMLGYRGLWWDDPLGAATALRSVLAEAAAVGDDSAAPLTLAALAQAEYLRGAWYAAAKVADEAYEAALQTGQRPQEALALATRALLHASRGEEDGARTDAAAALAITGPRAMAVARIHAVWALGLLELSLDRPAEAVAVLRRERERLWRAGVGEPGSMRFVGDEAEAHALLGARDEADRLCAWLEERGGALERHSALGAAHRCRAVLALEAGAGDEALRELDAACAAWERAGNPFELARTLLVRGAAERRAKRRRAARETLGAAHTELERLGAGLWAEKARAELGRIGGRAPSRGELTPTEREVALRAADGLTNREVASALVVSERTVEYHLSNVYRKLGVRSRTELARRLERAASR